MIDSDILSLFPCPLLFRLHPTKTWNPDHVDVSFLPPSISCLMVHLAGLSPRAAKSPNAFGQPSPAVSGGPQRSLDGLKTRKVGELSPGDHYGSRHVALLNAPTWTRLRPGSPGIRRLPEIRIPARRGRVCVSGGGGGGGGGGRGRGDGEGR